MTRRWILAGLMFGLVASGCAREADHPASRDFSVAPTTAVQVPEEEPCDQLPVSDSSFRVDRYDPTFSNPLAITNPLFPVARLDRVVRFGVQGEETLRVESTRLSASPSITLADGRRVATIPVQTIEWRNGRLAATYTDYYAQDDAGAVWRLGRDVAHYEAGLLVDDDGSWRAGPDGAPAMVVPANPLPGDVWRPQNICGFAFEELTVLKNHLDVEGPSGTIHEALSVRVLRTDGSYEDRILAPGYGDLSYGTFPDVVRVALATPTDGVRGSVPDKIRSLFRYADLALAFAPFGQWTNMVTTAGRMRLLFLDVQSAGLPTTLADMASRALDELDAAIAAEDIPRTRRAIADVELALLDLRLRYERSWVIDVVRLRMWEVRLQTDRQIGNAEAVADDLAVIDLLKRRLAA